MSGNLEKVCGAAPMEAMFPQVPDAPGSTLTTKFHRPWQDEAQHWVAWYVFEGRDRDEVAAAREVALDDILRAVEADPDMLHYATFDAMRDRGKWLREGRKSR